ncbi:MAG: hypothetical protein O7G85_09635, partial [Planctomycetota bacterium]|nr:hypothetical protein [Planctomycetota bacterium]
VEIVKRGESAEQGVGYMPDGTMVVVEDAGNYIGQTINLSVTNSLQTSAGRMIFGRMLEPINENDQTSSSFPSPSEVDEPAARSDPSRSSGSGSMAKAALSQPRTKDQSPRRDSDSRRNPRR